jgi:hypothetical protein
MLLAVGVLPWRDSRRRVVATHVNEVSLSPMDLVISPMDLVISPMDLVISPMDLVISPMDLACC